MHTPDRSTSLYMYKYRCTIISNWLDHNHFFLLLCEHNRISFNGM